MNRVLGAGLMVVLLLATLGEGGGAPASLLAWHAGLVGLLLVALGPGRRGSAGQLPVAVTIPFGLFLFAFALGAIRAPYGYGALTRVLEIAAFAAVVWIASRCGPGVSGWVALPLLAGAALQAGLVLDQRFIERVARPAGTFLNPNHLGAWLVAVLLLAVVGILATAQRYGAVLRALLAVPAVVGLMVMGSRGALLGLMAGAAWLSWVTWTNLGRKSRTLIVSGLSVVTAVTAVGVALRAHGFDPFRYQRVAIWKAALAPALDRPWTGVGPGQWDAAVNNLTFPLEDGPLRFERLVDSTHSDLIRLPAEFGWPAAIAAVLGIALLVREIRRRRRDGQLEGASQGAVAALIALGTQALVENLSSRPAVYLLAGALVGGLLSSKAERVRVGLAWRLCAVPLLLLGFVAADVAPFLAWSVQRSLPPGDATGSGSEVVLPKLLNPLHPEGWMWLAEQHSTSRNYPAAREHAEHAVRLQPADARYRLRHARIEGRWFKDVFGDEASRDRTVAHYHAAQELARHDAGIAIEEGAFRLSAADPLGARRAAERALAIEPNSVPAKLLLAEAVLAGGAPDAPEHAARLLDEAVATAELWAEHPKETDYARFHLDLDADLAAAARDRIEVTAATTAPD